jgi:hypothetical protein
VRRLAPVALLVLVVVIVLGACGPSTAPNLLIIHFDAGVVDARPGVAPDAPSDGLPPDASPYLGAPCVDDKQCDDMIACTYDSCDKNFGRCLNVPDDAQCSNGIYCDGKERCVPGQGCRPGAVVGCSDGNPCDIARCVEASKSCAYVPRDVDQDGDPDEHCVPHHDCNDLDPNVSSKHAEVCANGIDDNCNGLIDEMPCVTVQGGTCASAVPVAGAGTYLLSTVGSNKTFSTSCSVTMPSAGQNVVAAVSVPAGPNVDLDVWATSSVEVAVALQGQCGQPSTELACGSGPAAMGVRARARNVAPGTYYAVVTTQSPASVELKVEFPAPTPKATNVDCATALPIQPGTPTAVSIIDPATKLSSSCPAATGQLAYSFTLAQAQDVRVYATTLRGSGSPVIGLRDPICVNQNSELACQSSGAVPIYARGLSPGKYVVTVGATSPIDASVDVELAPPSAAPPDQTCVSPPIVAANARVAFDLSKHQNAIKDGCAPVGPDAAFQLALATASDVLLVERIPQTDDGAISLDSPACTMNLACVMGASPVRLGKRNVPAGDYRAVVEDRFGLQGTLDALVRPTVAPTIVPPGGADTCAAAIDASSGGFFTGDTTTASPDYSNPCDAPTSPPGGAPDQVLALNLAHPQRVVLDMEGSTYTTILDVRQGPSCPGTPVMGGCYVGFDPSKSFLDFNLPAGQYWIIIDGYQLQKGPWDLDIRVLYP